MMVARRMCSGPLIGSDLMPARTRIEETKPSISSRMASVSIEVGRCQASQHVEGGSRGRARGVDRERSGVGQPAHAGLVDIPGSQSFLPLPCHLGRQFVGRHALAAGHRLVDPGTEIGRGQVGEVEEEIGHVALGIDDQRRDPGQQRLLEEVDSQAGLARPGHSDDDAVGREIGRLIGQRPRFELPASSIRPPR